MKYLIVIVSVTIVIFLFTQTGIFNIKRKTDSGVVLECLQKYKAIEMQTKVYYTVLHATHDSLQRWISSGLSTTKSMRESKWYIDSVIFFNKSYTKCLFLVPNIFPDSSNSTDDCSILAGELINNKWQFYYQSYPANTYFRSHNNNKPYKAKELVFDTQKELYEDGLFNKEKYEINSTYLESDLWFSDWRKKMHKDFLNGKYNE